MTARSGLLLLCLAALPGCSNRAEVTPPAQAPPGIVTLDPAARQHAGITVGAVQTAQRADQTEAPGLLALDERRTARIGSLVDGIVLEAFVEVGDRVSAGQVLAHMHSPMVHESWAAYRKAIAERRRLEKELTFAVAAHERTLRLYADKATSLQEVQRAEADRVGAEEALDIGKTEVRRSEEELEHLGVTNSEDPSGESGEQIPIRSPLAGVVLERLVTPGTAVTTGTPLFVVSNLSSLWANIEIDESLLSHLAVAMPIELRVAAYPGQSFSGRVELIGDMVNPKTRRVTVRCAMANADGRLKPEMYATAVIRESEPHESVVVPNDAIQSVDGQDAVFVAEEGNRFRPRPVATGANVNGMVEIRSGLRAGERIAMTGAFVLKSELLKSATAAED